MSRVTSNDLLFGNVYSVLAYPKEVYTQYKDEIMQIHQGQTTYPNPRGDFIVQLKKPSPTTMANIANTTHRFFRENNDRRTSIKDTLMFHNSLVAEKAQEGLDLLQELETNYDSSLYPLLLFTFEELVYYAYNIQEYPGASFVKQQQKGFLLVIKNFQSSVCIRVILTDSGMVMENVLSRPPQDSDTHYYSTLYLAYAFAQRFVGYNIYSYSYPGYWNPIVLKDIVLEQSQYTYEIVQVASSLDVFIDIPLITQLLEENKLNVNSVLNHPEYPETVEELQAKDNIPDHKVFPSPVSNINDTVKYPATEEGTQRFNEYLENLLSWTLISAINNRAIPNVLRQKNIALVQTIPFNIFTNPIPKRNLANSITAVNKRRRIAEAVSTSSTPSASVSATAPPVMVVEPTANILQEQQQQQQDQQLIQAMNNLPAPPRSNPQPQPQPITPLQL